MKLQSKPEQIIREGFGKKLSIDFKTDESNIVTNIDKASEKLIMDFIRKEYPTHSIIAEESGSSKNSSEYTWVIDPLDGTTNFAHGLPLFSVSIGVQKNGKTIIGVIYDVMRDVHIIPLKRGQELIKMVQRIIVNNNSNSFTKSSCYRFCI